MPDSTNPIPPNPVRLNAIPPVVALVENQAAPEIFADNFAGLQINHGNVTITFAAVHADHTKDPAPSYRRVSARLVMPVQVVVEFQAQLANILKQLEAKGLVKLPSPGVAPSA